MAANTKNTTIAKDTLLRQHTLLRLIPEQPRSITTTVLQEKLSERGFDISLRTIQRDLVQLSTIFPLTSDQNQNRNVWYFLEGASPNFRDLDPPSALALSLAENHLRNLLPKTVLDLMAPQFRKASQFLDHLEGNHLAHWSRRVRALPNSKTLLPANIPEAIWDTVSTALLKRQQVKVLYLSRGSEAAKERVLHPAGLISRHTVSYLVASVDGYHDLRQFALHRMQSAEDLNKPANTQPAFNIDHYIQEELNTSEPIKPVRLVADIAPSLTWLLRETPLATDQQLTPVDDNPGWHKLTATIPNDSETRWWVFGLGEKIKVYEPVAWRDEIISRLNKALSLYK